MLLETPETEHARVIETQRASVYVRRDLHTMVWISGEHQKINTVPEQTAHAILIWRCTGILRFSQNGQVIEPVVEIVRPQISARQREPEFNVCSCHSQKL